MPSSTNCFTLGYSARPRTKREEEVRPFSAHGTMSLRVGALLCAFGRIDVPPLFFLGFSLKGRDGNTGLPLGQYGRGGNGVSGERESEAPFARFITNLIAPRSNLVGWLLARSLMGKIIKQVSSHLLMNWTHCARSSYTSRGRIESSNSPFCLMVKSFFFFPKLRVDFHHHHRVETTGKSYGTSKRLESSRIFTRRFFSFSRINGLLSAADSPSYFVSVRETKLLTQSRFSVVSHWLLTVMRN